MILQIGRKNESGSAPELYGQLIIKVTSLAQRIKAGEGFMKMEISSKSSAVFLVWKLIILRGLSFLVFSSEFHFTIFSFRLWSMGRRIELHGHICKFTLMLGSDSVVMKLYKHSILGMHGQVLATTAEPSTRATRILQGL